MSINRRHSQGYRNRNNFKRSYSKVSHDYILTRLIPMVLTLDMTPPIHIYIYKYIYIYIYMIECKIEL